MKLRHFTISNFYCTKCGNEGIPIGRRKSKQREYEHKKKLYCIYCKTETNHIEVRSTDNPKDILDNLKIESEECSNENEIYIR